MNSEVIQNDINNFILSRPHVFLLGAGASKAALPNGDRNGVECPVMDGFMKKTGLQHILEGTPYENLEDNLEIIYSKLHDSGLCQDKLKDLEIGIRKYFELWVILPVVATNSPIFFC